MNYSLFFSGGRLMLLDATRLSVIGKLDKGLALLGQFTRAARESVPQLYGTVMAGWKSHLDLSRIADAMGREYIPRVAHYLVLSGKF
jgi:hypothetical protein